MPLQARTQHGGARMAIDGAIEDRTIHDTSTTPSSPRPVRFGQANNDSGSSSAIQSLTSASTLSTRLDLSPSIEAGKGMLPEPVFGEWKDDTGNMDAESPEEMQKKDPLGTQIWKLYHKQKGQLPNSERLENLSWRMMSMNLRRKEMERQEYGHSLESGLGHKLT